VQAKPVEGLENPPSGVIDKLLLMSWVFVFSFILWVFKLLKRMESRRVVVAAGEDVRR
jgi:hypothetical protein